jgi:adenosylhomocysteine nucleosidase
MLHSQASSSDMPVTRLLRGPLSAAEGCQAVICVGLGLEAEIVAKRFTQEIGGADLAEGRAVLDRVADAGCRAIVSFGLAGGLSPELRAGDIVIASSVVGHNGEFATDDVWSGWLLTAIPTAFYARIAGVDLAVASSAQRLELSGRVGALAVDMESHLIGQIAARHLMRFVAVRVVVDAVNRNIPETALTCLSRTGEARRSELGRRLAARPRDTLDILRLWADWLSARRALANACEILSASVGQIGL